MRSDRRPKPRAQRAPRPLDLARLEELALAYVARFATSAAKLEAYLKRKLRERGWEDSEGGTADSPAGAPDIAALVARYVELGYVDDAGFARTRASGLLRRGYGPRRVDQALNAAGIGEEIRSEMRASQSEERSAAFAMAKKRGFGPFKDQPSDRQLREKQIAAMLRAGHGLDSARELVDAASIAEAEQWVAEALDEEGSRK